MTEQAMSSIVARQKPLVISALLLATVVKLLLAWLTFGTNDVATWRAFADTAARCGECAYYFAGPYGDPFNHPPFIVHFLKLIAPAGESFAFWLRLPAIVADIGSVVLVARLLPSLSTGSLVLLALNPVSILISGFHGNTDPVMICFVLAGIYAATKDRWALAGVALGMALNVKIVPLVVLPAFLLYPVSIKKRALFAVAVVWIVLVASLAYLANDPRAVASGVLGYRGLFVNWGLAHYFDVAGAPLHMLAAPLRYAILVAAAFLAWRLNRRDRPLFEICGVVFLTFYLLTPSLALQYLAWGVPFVIMLGLTRAPLFYGIAGGLIALQYHRWSQGLWYFADSHSVPPVTAETEFLSFALWSVCGFLLWYQLRLNTRHLAVVPS